MASPNAPTTLVLVLQLAFTLLIPCDGAKTTYNMDDRSDCNLAGIIDVGTDQTIYINAKQNAAATGMASCRIDFRAQDVQRYLKVEFRQFYFTGNSPCPVNLFLFYGGITQPSKTYNCMASRPSADLTESRTVSIRLDKTALDSNEYNFQIVITTYVDLPTGGGSNYGNSPVGAGVIVGIVAGIVVFLVVIFVVLCCCCKRRKMKPDEEARVRLGDQEPSNHSLGYVNENGRVYSDHDMKPKVTTFYGPGSPKTRNLSQNDHNINEKPPMLNNFDESPTRKQHFNFNQKEVDSRWKNNAHDNRYKNNAHDNRYKNNAHDNRYKNNAPDYHYNNDAPEEADDDVPQSPLLAAIRNSARYKAHYHNTEQEAEERSRRFSNRSSSAPSSPCSDPPTPAPSLPVLPRENILKFPQKPPGPKQASIRRAPRPASSSEEIARLEGMLDDQGDENIQIIPDSPQEKSQPGGVVAIQTADPHTPNPQRRGPFHSASRDADDFGDEEEIRPKNNTQHTLRPNRKRSPAAEKRKPPETGTPKQNKKQQNNQGRRPPGNERFQNEPAERREPTKKKSQNQAKSPRLGSLRKPRPSAASRLDDDDFPPSRPDTPTSIVAKGYRTDDLEAFSPLQRTGSRQSLYASRSSLYGRRGKRDRSSFSESVASYAHDDIDVYRHRRGDDEDRQITQRDRYFKSLGDIHYGGAPREQSTQTLRETATQTGTGMVTHSKARKSLRKSPKPQRAMTSSGSQTKNTKQPEAENKVSRYQKAVPKTKPPRNASTGVGTNGTEKKANGKPKSNGRQAEQSIPRPKTPEPVSSESEAPQRAATPESFTQNQPYIAPSPVPSKPVTYATHGHVVQVPPVTVYPQQPPHVYTPPPIQNYSAPPSRAAPSPAPYQPLPSAKSTKSPWEVLCDLTDGEYHSRAQSRGPGSQAGSSYSGHPKQPFHPGFRQPERFDNSLHPDRSAPPSRSQTPGYPPNIAQHAGRPDSAQSEPNTLNNLEAVPQPTMYPKKSSWEQLKQLTDSEYKLTYGASTYEHSESNV